MATIPPEWVGVPFDNARGLRSRIPDSFRKAGTWSIRHLHDIAREAIEKLDPGSTSAANISFAMNRLRPWTRRGKFRVNCFPNVTKLMAKITTRRHQSEVSTRDDVKSFERIAEQDQALRKTVDDLLASGAISPLPTTRDSSSEVWHRLFLVSKKPKGWRAIADLRKTNECFPEPPPFTHPSVLTALADPSYVWAAKLDIAAAFYKFPVDPEMRNFFAFHAVDQEGSPIAATYDSLPMGWTWSPFLMDTAMSVLDAVWAAQGLRIIRYADDLLIMGRTPREVEEAMNTVVEQLVRAGLHPSPSKTYAGAFTRLDFLGWDIDLVAGRIKWSTTKTASLMELIDPIRATKSASLRQLQKIAGVLCFLTTAEPFLRALYRRTVDEIAERERRTGDPHRDFAITAGTEADMIAWSNLAPRMATRWVRPLSNNMIWAASSPNIVQFTAHVDASAVGVGVVLHDHSTSRSTTRSFHLSDRDITAGSGVRELEAIQRALEMTIATTTSHRAGDSDIGPQNTSETLLHIRTDAAIVEHVWRRGAARALAMAEKMRSIADLYLRQERLHVSINWIPREQNGEADAASRALGSEATLPWHVVSELSTWASELAGDELQSEPAVDLFATAANTRAPIYYSRVPDPRAAGSDGLWPDTSVR